MTDERDFPQKLAITVCATDSYTYAMTAQARAVHANTRHLRIPVVIILVGGKKLKEASDLYTRLFSSATQATVECITSFEETKGQVPYKNQAQLLIAQMRTAAFSLARQHGATLCWSLDSDVIPKSAMCYRTLEWLLAMPGNYYEVAVSPYPSQGGGDMLTGRGTPEKPIAQDFLAEERIIPPELQSRIDANKAALAGFKAGEQPPPEVVKEATDLYAEIDKCMPKGNVFELSAKNGWRRRGWFSQAYPGIGRGCVVPTDWCGFGNTLMSRRALDEADFTGYEGAGTEDLFVVWHRWHQAGIRIGSAIHEPSGHVSRRKDGAKFFSMVRFITEADEGKGEVVGHIRQMHKPFYAHDKGEAYDPGNDGNPAGPTPPTTPPEKADPRPGGAGAGGS